MSIDFFYEGFCIQFSNCKFTILSTPALPFPTLQAAKDFIDRTLKAISPSSTVINAGKPVGRPGESRKQF